MLVCRKDDICVQNSNGYTDFIAGQIMAVITQQTIGKHAHDDAFLTGVESNVISEVLDHAAMTHGTQLAFLL